MTAQLRRTYVLRDKYRAVADILCDRNGSVLDIGARDRIIRQYLDLGRLAYFSADLGPGHDYQLDLEARLPLADASFDHIVALDVLEHVEHIHQAFFELARIARQTLIIGLPNMASLPRRWSFLWRGDLGTRKYDLLPEHQGDRHRWVTIYPQISVFIETSANKVGLVLEQVVEEIEGGRIIARLGYWAAAHGMLPVGWLTGRCIYVMARR